jgi:DNA-binding transcriptional ArsR family regulator
MTAEVGVDEILWALADSTRRGIVERLREERLRPSELSEALDVRRTTLSRHLRVLREAGLISEEIDAEDGRGRLIQLETEPLATLSSWLDDLSAFWSDQLEAFRVHAEGKARGKAKGKLRGRAKGHRDG